MSNADDDMDKPLTRREFHDAQAKLFAYLDDRFAQQDVRLHRFLKATESRLTLEIRGQISAVDQDHLDDLKKFEDKYRDLPARVSKLEAVVLAPPPAKRQRRR